jgi:isopenicillin N synthase-like dioxygenase
MQIHSGGLFQATPHYVRSSAANERSSGISRNTFAVFMQPDIKDPLDCPSGSSAEDVAVGAWEPRMTFGAFAEATLKRYYSM